MLTITYQDGSTRRMNVGHDFFLPTEIVGRNGSRTLLTTEDKMKGIVSDFKGSPVEAVLTRGKKVFHKLTYNKPFVKDEFVQETFSTNLSERPLKKAELKSLKKDLKNAHKNDKPQTIFKTFGEVGLLTVK